MRDYRPDELRTLIVDSSLQRPVGRAHRLLQGVHEPRKASLRLAREWVAILIWSYARARNAAKVAA